METEFTGGYLTGRSVLVTGAAARSAPSSAARSPAWAEQAIMLDHAEDNLFEIERELVEDRHVQHTVTVLADCKEGERRREGCRGTADGRVQPPPTSTSG